MKTFKLFLKSLFNNEACVTGGRHHAWWVSIILLVLSLGLSIVPVLVQTATKTGDSFIKTASYGVENGLRCFVEESNDKGLKMEVKALEDGTKYLDCDQAIWNATYTYADHYNLHAYQHKNGVSVVDFEVFYVSDLTNDAINCILNDAETVSETGEVSYGKRKTSVLVFGKTEVLMYLYNMTSTTLVGSCYGDYKNFDVGYNILSLENVNIDGQIVNHKNATPENYARYTAGVFENWKEFFNKSYLWNRGQLTWRTTLLMLGINAVLVVFMGLMIWILTRGKTNPFRIYTFLECQFISCWASFTPAILTLALGFLISTFSQVMFPLLLGVRVMWLSMKTLRPDYNTAPQQNQKTVKTVDTKPIKK